MWFSEKALVFVDAHCAALAVYKVGVSGPRLERFAFERLTAGASLRGGLKDGLLAAHESVTRLVRDLRAPTRGATLLLPLGACFPSIVDISALRASRTTEVEEEDLIRFRLAPLLPFPIAQAVVRSETPPAHGKGSVLAQATPLSVIAESEKAMSAFGFSRFQISSALSAALRGLSPHPAIVDLVLGDSACAVAVRNLQGAIEAIHLRLLIEGDDRGQRSLDEARRAGPEVSEIRVLGEAVAPLLGKAAGARVRSAFDEPALRDSADPQQFPFLAVFRQSAVP